jgi:hypothetical protein
MLVSVNEVAERLNITTRGVQVKCKRAKLKKIGNRYQITEEIANVWYNAAENQPIKTAAEPEANPERKEVFEVNSRKEPLLEDKKSSFVSFLVPFLFLVIIAVAIVFYLNLDNQIKESKATIQKTTIEHKSEVKQLTKQLNDAHDVIHNQELEIQSLKFRDSLRTFKKW